MELKPETMHQLAEKARLRGLSVGDYIRHMLEENAANREHPAKSTSPEEWEAALDEFTRSEWLKDISWTVDDSRASIYREREDAQL